MREAFKAAKAEVARIEAAMMRAAFAGCQRAIIRDEDDNPSDFAIPAHWVEAVALLVPRSEPWPGEARFMSYALGRVFDGEGPFGNAGGIIDTIARVIWSHDLIEAV